MFKKKRKQHGLLPDPKDPRDLHLSELQPESVELSNNFDLRDNILISDQNYGSCQSHAVTKLSEYWNSKEYNRKVNLSEKFVYYNTKKVSGLWHIQGDYARSSLKALQKYGSPLLKDYPDDPEGSWEEYIDSAPPGEIYEKAKKYRIKSYWRVHGDLESIRQAIYKNKCPVLIGTKWYKSYNDVVPYGKLPLPGDKVGGGHLFVCSGWTDAHTFETGKLWFANSWGKDYGADGFFYIPFPEFNKHDFWDIWVALDLEVPERPKTGWVADSYLKMIKGFNEGDKVTPTYNLNFRDAPWGSKIGLLKPGEKLEILGESKKSGNITWQKVEIKD